MAPESILIAGTGALASLFAARLAPYAQVTLLGTWSQGLAALKQHGVRLISADDEESVHAVRATDDPADCSGHRFALVLVKSWQTERVARQLSDCLAEYGVALTLQNGLGNLEVLAKALGEERVALGVTTTGATLLGPGRVREGGAGLTQLAAHPRLEPLISLLHEAGFATEIATDLESVLWGKLIVNAGINPLTAILGVPNGVLLERPHAHELMRATVQEAVVIASARGIRLPYPDPVAAVEQVARKTGSNRSSMLQDVSRGAPTEIDAINGAIVRQGREVGIPAPINKTLWHLVHGLVSPKQGEMA